MLAAAGATRAIARAATSAKIRIADREESNVTIFLTSVYSSGHVCLKIVTAARTHWMINFAASY